MGWITGKASSLSGDGGIKGVAILGSAGTIGDFIFSSQNNVIAIGKGNRGGKGGGGRMSGRNPETKNRARTMQRGKRGGKWKDLLREKGILFSPHPAAGKLS